MSSLKRLSIVGVNFREKLQPLIWGFLALAACDLLQMIIPRITGRAIDILAEPKARLIDLLPSLGLIMGLALTVAFLRITWRHLIYGFARYLEKDLRRRLHAKFLSLSLSWRQDNSSGDLMALATNDIESVRMAVGFGLVSFMDAVVMGLSAIVFMLAINPALCFYAFLPMPLITILTKYFGQAIYLKVLEIHDIFGQLTETVRERLNGIKVIRALGLETLSQTEVAKISLIHVAKNTRLALTMGLFFPLMTLLTNLALALTLSLGGKAAMAWEITPGDFVAFITYLALLSWPMMALGFTLGLMQQGLAALDRLGRVLWIAEPSPRPIGRSIKPPASLEIVFDQVNFAYRGRSNPVLSELSLTCPAGLICALTGPTGSGKSSLAALLPALYEPTGGQILLNGLPTTQWSLASQRALFGYAPQDGHIFTGSLGQNLAVGRPEATERQLIQAAEMANLPIDLSVFPEGLETIIGEKGLSLSGGQRQRLALARAWLRDPLFMILDDTLSAVDAAVEETILANLIPTLKSRNRGALIISHRLTTLKTADRVFVLENGRLSDWGTAQELADRPGYFQRISQLANRWPERRLG
ncbi:MAG: ABC transporter ATP-binding protein/permease [Deltaproteobacteria bacterium]|jgi:ATP-binding cassette subfamily B protein|nr:ABC transporter ATP-binding protein/permease [Deltaproteobacteria bacterium]